MSAERAFVGALLIDPDARNTVPPVAPEDFADQKCRLVFEAIQACADVDFVLVSCELERRGTLERVGTGFLTALCLHTPTSLHAAQYAQAVIDAAAVRRAATPTDRHSAAI